MEEMKVQLVPIENVKPYENNPRDNDDAVDAVANSIKEFGWQQPIVIDTEGVIIAGHTRYKAAKKLGYKTVPVHIADDLTEEQANAYRLADNKSGDLAEWNFGKLNEELQAIENLDMTDFGFDESDLDLADDWNDSADLDDYEEPSPTEEKILVCPHCGYEAKESEFKE